MRARRSRSQISNLVHHPKAGRNRAHLGDLFDWSLTLIRGEGKWRSSTPQDWKSEKARFFASLKRFDDALVSASRSNSTSSGSSRGQFRDAFTHTGQLAMLHG